MERHQGSLDTGDGNELHFEIAGAGDEIVLVTNACFLSRDLDPLAQARRVVFVDSRGRGGSSPVRDLSTLTFDQAVDDLDRVRAHLRADRVALIGWSAGGNIACSYAMDYPGRVTRVLTIGFLPRRRRIQGSSPEPDEVAEMQRRTAGRVTEEHWAKVATLRDQGLDESDPVAYWREDLLVRMRYQMGRPEALANMRSEPWQYENEWGDRWRKIMDQLRASRTRDRSGVLGSPTLLMYGEEEAFPAGADPEWVWDHRDTRLLMLPGVGHYPWLEDPKAFFPAAELFLSGEWPEAATPVP